MMAIAYLGTTGFLTVYFGASVASSLSSVMHYTYLEPYLRKRQNKPMREGIKISLGASGALMGVITTIACINPMAQFSIFFVINMPAAVLLGLFGAYETYNILSTNTGRFDSAGHLGGGFFGIAYYLSKIRPYVRHVRIR
ncbi:hypothetical protein BGW38_004676 [Lunasporangiospora selenospora]|uniref:Peptidase S54 rhomboid domain-containing protein n=1 Tax=Lunasporangiospora selenospora TaxID=979761 RepID=A0A9P6FR03_9FUNG|nr:hypothetical protein BGW38_004676 [Lunasporangiospora selenospora]